MREDDRKKIPNSEKLRRKSVANRDYEIVPVGDGYIYYFDGTYCFTGKCLQKMYKSAHSKLILGGMSIMYQ